MSDAVTWKNRIVGEGEQPASQFIANPNNWRVHPRHQRDAMRGALNEVGWVQRVIVNRRTGYLVDGHERVWQALQNGDAMVPYVEVDLSPEEESYVLATLDPIGAMAKTDDAKLRALLQEVDTQEDAINALLSGLLDEDDGKRDDRTLEEIDLDMLPDKPVWVLCAVPTALLPDVRPLLQQIELLGVQVEMSSD